MFKEVVKMPNLIPKTGGLETLRESVMNLFDRWMPSRQVRENAEELAMMPSTFLSGPAVDVVETGNLVRVTAEMPGLTEKDFQVEVLGDRLILRGEKRQDREEKREDYYCHECSYGSFSRTVALPCEVDSQNAKATLRNGMLTVELPKTEAGKGKRVNVNVS